MDLHDRIAEIRINYVLGKLKHVETRIVGCTCEYTHPKDYKSLYVIEKCIPGRVHPDDEERSPGIRFAYELSRKMKKAGTFNLKKDFTPSEYFRIIGVNFIPKQPDNLEKGIGRIHVDSDMVKKEEVFYSVIFQMIGIPRQICGVVTEAALEFGKPQEIYVAFQNVRDLGDSIRDESFYCAEHAEITKPTSFVKTPKIHRLVFDHTNYRPNLGGFRC
ncbi:hypothetical protein HYU11_01250 [Candidatus Woesearchaeota archaeon]|nr:hypothetical protein [Candidatus Woesearchaeota archaeon]